MYEKQSNYQCNGGKFEEAEDFKFFFVIYYVFESK